MASIESLGSFTNQSSSFNFVPRICQCRAIARDCGELWLPISRRGHFFSDSIFENSRTYFHSAIQEMLSKWKDMNKLNEEWLSNSQSLANSFSLYRQLRSSSNQEDNQASTLVSDSKSHKVVMDVQDFVEGGIKVKVLGEKEVVVEGQGNGSPGEGSFSSRRFCRNFTFPSSVNMADVTSVLSSDGVLTIEAPKMTAEDKAKSTRQIPVEIEGTTATASSSSESVVDISAHSDATKGKNDVVYYCRDCNKKIGSWHKAPETKLALQEGVKVPININASSGAEKIIPVQQEASPDNKNDTQTTYINIEKEWEAESRAKISKEHKDTTENANVLQVESKANQKSASNTNCYDVPVMTGFSLLPVSRRGPFFSDSYFRSVQKDFQSAVQEILSRWGAATSMLMEDNLSAYRRLRLQNFAEETQAVKTAEDETNHKFVLDVQDFMNGGEVTVKAINDREIVIEGQIEKEEGGLKSLKRFLKRFSVPGNLKLESVSSVVSSDGVLTITAPKKPSSIQLKEVIVPVSIEAADAKDVVVKKTQENQNSSNSSFSSTDNNSEGNTICTTSQNVSNQIKVQRDCTDKNFESSKLQSQASQAGKECIIPVNVEGVSAHTRQQSLDKQTGLTRKFQEEKQDLQVQQQTVKDQAATDRVIPINIQGSPDNTKAHSVAHQKDCIIPISVEAESSHVKAESFGDKIKQQNESKESNASAIGQNDKCHFLHQRAKAASSEKALMSNRLSDNLACTSAATHYLPIARKGLFLDDTFFGDYQKSFQEAVKDVLVKSRHFMHNEDCMTAYRSLRQSDLRVENQALYAQEDNDSFKVAVDAKDFINGDLTVRVKGEELVIEGKAENSEAKSANSLTFSHRFLLPESFNMSTITSAISSDGILTVQCPKRANAGSADGVRKMSTEARSKHESHTEGAHKWEEKKVKQSSEQGDGCSSRTLCSSYNSCQQQSSQF
ncbi:uncharacterized protein LOC135196963 [Macrobrachium nipponense]|uniref:uncharacterized protein LOC135196963 n=1 Tax=Macrobrachium nipponense TaxID=159736 RepID=UPI0030C7FC8F